MLTLAEQIKEHADRHIRGGSKENRGLEVTRITLFLEWVETHEKIRHIDRLGKRQVVAFWRAHRDMKPLTQIRYWRALKHLWQWGGKPGLPPKPYTEDEIQAQRGKYMTKIIDTKNGAHSSFQDIGTAISSAMTARGLSTGQLANLTGVEKDKIEALMSNKNGVELTEINVLLTELGIRFKI